MKQPKLRLTSLGAALATTAVFAGSYVAENETVVATPQETVIATEPVQIAEPAIAPAAEPAAPAPIARTVTPAEPAITVTEQRLTEDQRIQAEVMDKLANNPTLSGKVGVESKDSIVNLSGYLTTNGMVMRANRDAASVVGVRYVVNEIRTKVGPVTY
jgi:hypothetical protein